MGEPTRETVLEALKGCYDPEIPVNIVDLGLIYNLNIKDGDVSVKMALTAPGCPMGLYIVEQVKQTVMKLKDIRHVDVEIVDTPPWTPDRMTDEGRKALGFYS